MSRTSTPPVPQSRAAGADASLPLLFPVGKAIFTLVFGSARASEPNVISEGLALMPAPFSIRAVVPGASRRRAARAPRGGVIHVTR
jgi:hypothetical protein